jgi:CRP-like cAMP-binding protein
MPLTPAQLKGFKLFSRLPDPDLEVLAKNMRPLHIEAGQALVEEGVTTRGPLMLVMTGALEVSRRDIDEVKHTLAKLQPPTVIGEMEFLADIGSSATVTAVDEVSGFLLPRDRFEALFDQGEAAAYHLALAIGRIVSERLAATNVALTRALSKKPEQLAKVQKAIDSKKLADVDAELEALLK